MFDYFEFITALRSIWITRLIQYRTKWKNLFEAIINEGFFLIIFELK